MTYRIEISSVAEAEADRAFLRLSQIMSPTKASHWYSGLLQAIESLSQMPNRCPLARENASFSQEIRQLLYGRGRNSYRILFTVLEGQNVSTVRILHTVRLSAHVEARHASQLAIDEDPKEPDAT